MLLTIVVLSYNRPSGIERILKNLIGYKSSRVSLLIKDDCSPKFQDIKNIYKKYRNSITVKSKLYLNRSNLGFAGNLIDAFNVLDSKFIMFLSDDDYIFTGNIEKLLDQIELNKSPIYFSPYTLNGEQYRNNIFPYAFHKFSDVIYNSVLFSGLIFNRLAVQSINYDSSYVKKSIHPQVILASLIVYKYKKIGFTPQGILVVGNDMENFFGKNKYTSDTHLLSNRKKVDSHLIYQQYLIDAVEYIAINTNMRIKKIFWRSYRIRLIAYLIRVRSLGLRSFISFFKSYILKNIKRDYIVTFFFIFFLIVPKKISKIIYSSGIKHFKKSG